MEIYLYFLSSPFFSFSHFDCAKNRNSLFLSACLVSCMAQKIYSETFITSKNPTEWSFTWIAFNNNPFPSSVFVFAPIRSSSSTFSRFLYQPTKYLFMVLDSILRSSVLLYLKCKWNWGSKYQQKLHFTTSMEEKSPNFPYFNPVRLLTPHNLLLAAGFIRRAFHFLLFFFSTLSAAFRCHQLFHTVLPPLYYCCIVSMDHIFWQYKFLRP